MRKPDPGATSERPTQRRIIWKRIGLVCASLLLSVVLLELGLRAAGWIVLAARERQNRTSLKERGHYRILCLGESTTADGEIAYPRQLEAVLNGRATGLEFKVINRGVAGTDTAQILSGLDANLDRYEPDLVVTMIGVNDRNALGGTVRYEHSTADEVHAFITDLRVYKLGRYVWDSLGGDDWKQGPGRRWRENAGGYEMDEMYRDLLSRGEKTPALEAGRCLTLQGQFAEAEQTFRSYLAENPESAAGHVGLGWFHLVRANWRDEAALQAAVTAFERAIELDSTSYEAFIGMAVVISITNNDATGADRQRSRNESRQHLLKAIAAAPEEAWPYFGLGYLFIQEGAEDVGIKLMRMAMEKDPQFGLCCHLLAVQQRRAGDLRGAKETYRRAVEAGLQDDILIGHLAACCDKLGERELAEHYYTEANRARIAHYRPSTRYNYNRLKERVLGRGIKLLAVQYPMRSVASLKKLLAPADRVLFVDNEASFKDGVSRHGFDRFFRDRFAGDFGHCTREGNRLLATNVANAILRTCLGG